MTPVTASEQALSPYLCRTNSTQCPLPGSRYRQAKGLEGADADSSAWEVRMASKYYKLLFKEYALADLSR